MCKKLRKIRDRKFVEQGSLCFYCNQPMWAGTPKKFQIAHSISKRQADWFQCTAEHLMAAAEGGADSPANIVAACKFCNSMRHRAKRPLAPDSYKAKVRRRLDLGRWLRLPKNMSPEV